MRNKIYLGLKWAAIIGIAILSMLLIWNIYFQFREAAALNTYLKAHQIRESQTWEVAKDLSNTIRMDFNTNKASWNFINPNHEPILKYSALQLLNWKEGHCGKGTRVLVLLLQKLGYDATRISLYGEDFKKKNSHTLVSVMINGKEYFIDSINSGDWINKLLQKQQINASIFEVPNLSPGLQQVTKSFRAYSYESFPLVQLSKGLGVDPPWLNHTRPSRWWSWLIESVYFQKIILNIVGIFLLGGVCLIIRKVEKRNIA